MPDQTVTVIAPDSFEAEQHFYPRTLNAQIHPLVANMFALDRSRIVSRYCHLNPKLDRDALMEVLSYRPRFFCWAGADLFHVTTSSGHRDMVVIETNSCPSGQKSMPVLDERDEQGGYRPLVQKVMRWQSESRRLPQGVLAVLYDKNMIEASGYASAMADEFQEKVYLVPWYANTEDAPAKVENGIIMIRAEGEWRPVRLAFRYVTQKPWTRIPVVTKTGVVNPVLICLAGGRNKLMAAKAYDVFNGKLSGSGLSIRTPETIRDVSKNEIPLWVEKFGGLAVVKNPYSNAGQGVWTLTSSEDLSAFMELDQPYDRFIVQSLIGNYNWSSTSAKGRYYHVGTVPDRHGRIYAADLRFMIIAGREGFEPMAAYGRRARKPLKSSLDTNESSWDMLGTNLSRKNADGSWGSDTNRLLLMDRRDFNKMGLGLDDLVEGYIQTVLSACAIDHMAQALLTQKGKFRNKLFRSLNDDPSLVDEILLP